MPTKKEISPHHFTLITIAILLLQFLLLNLTNNNHNPSHTNHQTTSPNIRQEYKEIIKEYEEIENELVRKQVEWAKKIKNENA